MGCILAIKNGGHPTSLSRKKGEQAGIAKLIHSPCHLALLVLTEMQGTFQSTSSLVQNVKLYGHVATLTE
jgi:hypothetical protein